MPPETPMPWRAKLTFTVYGAGRFVIGSALLRIRHDSCTIARRPSSLAFAEAVADERAQRVHRRNLVGALDLERDARSLASRQHHHAHDALRVHLASVARDLHVAL